MLGGTRRSPREVIGKVAPKNGLATVEKIAVNAVMAGARPEYLPVILAAMEVLTDRRFDLLHMTASTGSFTLQVVVNGPLSQEIGVCSGIGMLGYGWRANNTIGHALRLCLINLGHVWPAENDMALIGRPSSHTFYVFAENEKQSPWKPYHVLQGFAPEESCVTVSTVMVMSHAIMGGTFVLGGGAVEPWSPQSILDNMAQVIRRSRSQMTLWKRGSAFPSPLRYSFVLHPELAMDLDRLGFCQKDLQAHLYEQTRVPYEDLTPEEIRSIRRRAEAGEIPRECIPDFSETLRPGGKVPLLLRPQDCHIVVAGGIPGYSFVTPYFSIPPYADTAVLTKAIHGATLTKAGR